MFRNAPQLAYDDLVTGEKFVSMCDEIFFHYRHLPFRDHPASSLFYADTHHVEELFQVVPKDRPIKIVTHNSDRAVTSDLAAQLPANVTAWFSHNIACEHPRVFSLPIGLENERWFPELQKKQKILSQRNGSPSKLLYMNHAIFTNPAQRQRPFDLLKSEPWCTAKCGRNGVDFDGYLKDISDHYYVLSPEGHGIDCHRTWEALYMNRIPVMTRNHNTKFYEDLPILFVDDWAEVTEQRLRDKLEWFLGQPFNFEKLKIGYWKTMLGGMTSRFIGDQ